MSDVLNKKFFCPRLLDYIVLVGARHPSRNHTVQSPELLRRYPLEDHKDFFLPPDVVYFCQPEGCISVGPKRMSLRESNSFVFTLTEKDSARIRFGMCVNFYRPIDRKSHDRGSRRNSGVGVEKLDSSATSAEQGTPGSLNVGTSESPPSRVRRKIRNHSLTSLCIISHHPFFSTLRECLFVLKRLIEVCNERTASKKVGGSRTAARDSVWSAFCGQCSDNTPSVVLQEIKEIETWILKSLSAPVPVPGITRVEVEILPRELSAPLTFALPDHTRFSLVDFPLHLPLELLGVETCLKVLTCIILEHKIVLQSRDYNALSMSVMAFVSMIYPLEYMFPVIPLLPTCMTSAEQLLLAPTPYIIGVPASFFLYKKHFKMPDDVWLVDLDSNKITVPLSADELPNMPEPEGTILKNHLKQALASMSMGPQPIKNLDKISTEEGVQLQQRRESLTSTTGFNPFIYGNDVDSVDIATRVAMVRFLNSPNLLANFSEHTRTLRLYPRPVVAFQVNSFLRSRPKRSGFLSRLARTQAVEYFAEWSLSPTNVSFQRVQTGVFDPTLIGDKAKWYSHQLEPVHFRVYNDKSTIWSFFNISNEGDNDPTDESGSDSDGAESTSSSYSSLSDFVTDMVNSEINGNTPHLYVEEQALTGVDHASVYQPPSTLQIPTRMTSSDSAFSIPGSLSTSSSHSSLSSPSFVHDPEADLAKAAEQAGTPMFHNLAFRAESQQGEQMSDTDSQTPTDSESTTPTRKVFSNPAFEQEPVGTVPPDRKSAFHVPSISLSESSVSPMSSISRMSPMPSPRVEAKKSFFKQLAEKEFDKEPSPTPTSIISSISSELNGYAASTSSMLSELFGGKSTSNKPKDSTPPFGPFPKGRKGLVERSSLIKHNGPKKKAELQRQQSLEAKTNTHSENQQFLKETINYVLEGEGVSWLKVNKLKKLMEDENYRNLVVSRLNKSLEKKLTDEDHIEDVCVNRQVWKGMLKMLQASIVGLEHTYSNYGLGGMASAFQILEIVHTHYWSKDIFGDRPEGVSPISAVARGGGDNSMQYEMETLKAETKRLPEEVEPDSPGQRSSESGGSRKSSNSSSPGDHSRPSPTIIGPSALAEFELEGPKMLERELADRDRDVYMEDTRQNLSGLTLKSDMGEPRVSEDADRLLRNLMREKSTGGMQKFSSMESEVSEASTLVSTHSDFTALSEGSVATVQRRTSLISHHSIHSTYSDSEVETGNVAGTNKKRSPSVWNSKSSLSTGFRYHGGSMINTSSTPSPDTGRTYLFQGLLGKERSALWDQMQFWEDAFLDAVAQERDIVGMDQGPGEMIERYSSLGESDRKRLEQDEDRLLANMLYNMVAFMVMMEVNKQEIRKKVRRMIGKSHVGLVYSQEVNELLDQINNLHGNDIDLKPLGSRQMHKQSFTVHSGTDANGDMLFMDVRDDGIILRSINGQIIERWWYERLVNMTYSPKTKVLCLWRRNGGQTQLNKFYTKKCRELYYCVKEAMERAAARGNGVMPDLGGEFPVQDMKTGEGGLLQVCMEGVGLLFVNSKFFVELGHIRKCFTQKGGIFVLEEYNPKSKQVIQRRYKSSMADQICYAVLCVFSYVAAGIEHKKQDGENQQKKL